MVGRYKVITLCGSTRFKDDFLQTQKRLTLEGNIVISVGLFDHADNEEVTIDQKKMIDDMQCRKIDMADEVLIIDTNGYVGPSTRSQIEYALEHNKPVSFLSHHRSD